ncbi:MAG TPA: rRNA maturation RNase YbeY [Ignavibacteria bacterium]|nr:rRNA maturation RNase YbeY [Ignavibacteria bacterium]HMR38993.1 rRNA maturation RNase YbeY [Ignavibacteria bacterium]
MKINFLFKKKIQFSREIKTRLKDVIKYISGEEKTVFGNINIVFCGDEFIKAYNREYLDHDYETDIITFHDTDENGFTEGELLISSDTVKFNSERFKTNIEEEFSRVIIHGILHLCGYRDETKSEKTLMRKKENFYLKELNES